MKMIMLLMMAAEPSAAAAPDVQLLDFTAGYCQPCQQMLPILQRMERDKFPVRRIDITEEHEMTKRFAVDLLPTLVLLVEGKEVKRFVGLTDEAELRNEMIRAARKLTEARAEAKRAEAAAQRKAEPSAADAGRAEKRVADAALSEQPRRSVGDIFSGLWGRNARPAPIDDSTVRGQSPEAAARLLTGLQAAEAATVRVRVAGQSTEDGKMLQDVGAGTIIHSAPGQALILTCAHVFLNIATDNAVVDVEVFEGGKGTRYPAKLVRGDHNSDLAILKVQTSKILPAVRLTQLSPKTAKGQALVSFGCDDGADPTRLDTQLIDINRYDGPSNLVCSKDPKSGRSGGGLFNSSGELMGVCSCADRKQSEGLYMAHEAILRFVSHLKLQPILLKSAVGSGEDAAATFAEMSQGGSQAVEPESGRPKPVNTPSQEMAERDAPTFDESPSPVRTVSADSANSASSAEDTLLTDAPPFVPGGMKPRRTIPVTAALASGPRITILIDDRTPGSEKKVIVIPNASPWMMELITGESADSTPAVATTALRPATGGSTKSSAKRTTSDRSLTQVP